jgi:hypothetical protein
MNNIMAWFIPTDEAWPVGRLTVARRTERFRAGFVITESNMSDLSAS